jgi:DNA segregation ATPase FtsK/SpoIIIE, S-DNA-T family
MDNHAGKRENAVMPRGGELRHRLARTLNAAYGDGLLSEATLAYRLDLLFASPVVEPARVTGDLTFRTPRSAASATLARARASWRRVLGWAGDDPARLLALDWAGGREELLVGRDLGCDIVLSDPTVSRRHVRLVFSDGTWSLRDLDSTNGTSVNGSLVKRCQLCPGDRLRLGDEILLVD